MSDPEIVPQLPAPVVPAERLLTAPEFHRLAEVPPEFEWFANIRNLHTRRAYENAIDDFMRFTGIARPDEFRTVTRAHVIAWRDDLDCRELGSGEPVKLGVGQEAFDRGDRSWQLGGDLRVGWQLGHFRDFIRDKICVIKNEAGR